MMVFDGGAALRSVSDQWAAGVPASSASSGDYSAYKALGILQMQLGTAASTKYSADDSCERR